MASESHKCFATSRHNVSNCNKYAKSQIPIYSAPTLCNQSGFLTSTFGGAAALTGGDYAVICATLKVLTI